MLLLLRERQIIGIVCGNGGRLKVKTQRMKKKREIEFDDLNFAFELSEAWKKKTFSVRQGWQQGNFSFLLPLHLIILRILLFHPAQITCTL